MRILITGGAGYIGSHTITHLLRSGHHVFVYDNLSTGFRVACPESVEFFEGEILDTPGLSGVLKTQGIEAVIHLAGKVISPESVLNPIEYYLNNTLGVLSVARACVECGIDKIIFSSSGSVYGDSPAGDLLTEESPTCPQSPYAASKLMSEEILRDFERCYGLRSVCLRFFVAAGAASDKKNGQRTSVATQLIQIASQAACGKRDFVDVCGTDFPTPDGSGVRDYIHVEDLAELHLLALEYLERGARFDVFNCGYGLGYSVFDIVKAFQRVSGVHFSIRSKPRRPGDPPALVADSTKARRLLGWVPKMNNLEQICRTSFEWEKSEQS